VFTVKIIQNTALQIIIAAGTHSYHSALKVEAEQGIYNFSFPLMYSISVPVERTEAIN
jgi:hypothetical protein